MVGDVMTYSNDENSINSAAERTLSTIFSQAKSDYGISVSASPEFGGTVTGAGTYKVGALVTVTATARTDYRFVNWTENGIQVSSNETYQFTANADRILVAYFQYVLPQYQVTLSSSPEVGGTVSGAGKYNVGALVTVTAKTNSNYRFVNWTEGGIPLSTNDTYQFSARADRTLTANFQFVLPKYQVTLSAFPEFAGTVSGAGMYDSGTNVTVTATPNSGIQFVNWTENNVPVSTEARYTFAISGPRTLVAHFVPATPKFQVEVSTNPVNAGTVSGAGMYEYGANVTVAATANNGYQFVNWTENNTPVSSDIRYAFSISGSRTLVANFTPVVPKYQVQISANPLDAGTVSGAGTYDSGANVTVVATANSGYQFVNWTENNTPVSSDIRYTFSISSTRTLVANFIPIVPKYQVQISANPVNAGTVSGAGTYDSGANVAITATANSGYQFVNWTENNTPVSSDIRYTFPISSSRTLVANFAPIIPKYQVQISANPVNAGTVSGAGTYDSGANVTITAAANSGYQFVNWTENNTPVSSEMRYTFSISGSRTLVAHFIPVVPKYQVVLSTDPEDAGVVTGDGMYDSGANVTITATANAGYQFVNWTENNTPISSENRHTFAISGSRTLVAHFTPVAPKYQVVLSTDPEDAGVVTGDGMYDSGANIIITATANAGYQFINWIENGVSVSSQARYAFQISGPRNLIAHFTSITPKYTVEVSTKPVGAGTVSGAGMYDSGAYVTTTAIANSGYQFVNWTENGTSVSSLAQYSFHISGPRTLVANFVMKSAVPSLSLNRSATGLTITFTGTLQSADSLTGTWTDVLNVTSPFIVPPSGTRKFYRTRNSSDLALSLTRSATGLTITFTGTLQSADSLTGIWTDVVNATSPFAVPLSSAHKFYRIKR